MYIVCFDCYLLKVIDLLYQSTHSKSTTYKQACWEIFFVKKSYLATLEASETTEDVLERREELEDVCPIGNAHLTMVFNQERF